MHHGIKTIEGRRDATRLSSVLLGLMECTVQQDLSGIYCQNISTTSSFAITYISTAGYLIITDKADRELMERPDRKERVMKRIKETAVISMIVMLMSITAFCIFEIILLQDKNNILGKEQYYRRAEQEYVQEIRDFLEQKGYGSSGVTMNKIIEADGTREYTVLIHHKRIDSLDDEGRRRLANECREIEFSVEGCIFNQKFF